MPEEPQHEEEAEDDRPWDEHRWERFLQESDRRTEKFGQLLEKYQDHPERDALIAREMGWETPGESEDDEDLDEWQRQELAAAAAEAEGAAGETEEAGEEDEFERQQHPLFQEAQAYVHRLLRVVQDRDEPAQRPIHEALVGGAMICAAKLSVLSLGEPRPELGMIIAYAKRGLKALTDSLGAIEPARRVGLLSAELAQELQAQAFEVRGGIVALMGEYRAEFRRRHP
ncbi:MAG: hypothetical protein JSR82_17330 [Verrucomicrobia bacterium]|nr:hypothetical protein [Verrucomicrobiota bacterium]